MKEYALLIVSAALVNNVILGRFLGLCPTMGVTTRLDAAVGMGMATTFVITVSSMADRAVGAYLLEPYNLWYLRTVTFIMVIAAAVQFTELTVKKVSPHLFQMLGIYLPLITTNCAVLGIGYEDIHSTREHIAVDDLVRTAQLIVNLVEETARQA